jgi:hypothetical protein
MEAARTSETSVDNYFTRQYIPEDKSELHTRRRENLKSLILNLRSYFNVRDHVSWAINKFWSRLNFLLLEMLSIFHVIKWTYYLSRDLSMLNVSDTTSNVLIVVIFTIVDL